MNLHSIQNHQKNPKVIRLINNCVKDYDWGSTNPNSYVSKLSKSNKLRWAQLWMGTHPNGQSSTYNGKKLSQYLKQQNLGEIKFLFKVLSIQKCLSIQIHPNKTQARQLHLLKPQIYVDQNDKPEMFITLTEFQCFLGCISDQQLLKLLQIPPFNSYINKQIKSLLAQILSKDPQTIKQEINVLLQNKHYLTQERSNIINQLMDQFPNDVGILASCFLHYQKIQPGCCYYISPKTPHAYIRGECIELMKNSDNVIRLGLTNKLKDTETMLNIIETKNQIEKIVKNIEGVYKVQQFEIYEINEDSRVKVKQISIGIVVEGNFQINKDILEKGDSFVLTANEYLILGKGKLFLANYLG